MKLIEILEKYSDPAIDQISADKVDESANLRLPRSIIIKEIQAALSSLSYVASALAPSRPPDICIYKIITSCPKPHATSRGFSRKSNIYY